MKKPLALGSLLLLTSTLVAPAALAQTGSAGAQTTSPPAGSVVAPDAGGSTTPDSGPGATTTAQDAAQQEVEISGPGASGDGEDIVVIGRNIPNVIRNTAQVVSVLSTEDIARTGEGDIAGALSRVTGLSVVGNGFVFVRGLGDRYSSSLLNGSPLPSPEPLRRVVPLDIFPTNVIASSLVQKSFSANYPGEFGGGVINLTTRAAPKESFLQFGGSVGFDTVTTAELGYTYDGGSHDWLGYDSGERSIPDFIREAGRTGAIVTPDQVVQLTNAETSLVFENRNIPANFSGELSAGTSFDLGTARIGVITGGGLSNTWRTRDAIQQVPLDAQGGLAGDARSVATDHRALVNGLFGVGAEVGRHRFRWTNLYVHDTLKQAIMSDIEDQNNQPLFQQNTNWFERQLFTTQGVAELKFDRLSVDLRGAYANTQRNSPYERTFVYFFEGGLINDYVNNLTGQQGVAQIAFSELNEDLWSGGVDLAYDFGGDRPLTLQAGYAYSDADRTSFRYQFRYQAGTPLNDAQKQQRPDFLLSDLNVQLNNIFLQNESNVQGAAAYTASLRTHAGYAQVEAEVADGLRAQVGVRYEDAEQRVLPVGANVAGTNLTNGYWLPASTITWNFARDMQLRLHASKTIARPQFRELAPQLYLDFESNRQFVGNPFLTDSELWNLEARYEWFFARDQRITLAGFYKRIDNPIEAFGSPGAGSSALLTSFSNAPSARLYGGELELQKYFPLDGLGLGDLFATKRALLIANYTYTKSELNAQDQPVVSPFGGTGATLPARFLFQDGASLVGQSDHIVNAQFGLEDTEMLSQVTLLVNYASDRVTNRGAIVDGGRLPDIRERPGVRFDVVWRQGIPIGGDDKQVELKFEARNLSKTRYQEFQIFDGGLRREINTYDLGRIFTFGVSVGL
ncbi:TonB-dependent receptor [Sphingomonas spermidinifaciens]|uniref:TonB-dependent receptor n=1 Tax=Sphingomonas spermidinifaciens TaxID=1141889 RepID=A0A2A4B738_9SPHN|nr:TonB-dependent receptor [Sphingomonas spermidinifaciens]PCD03578.1 TonB-dependent receptor [Sphingomonas spermidinifaciens]